MGSQEYTVKVYRYDKCKLEEVADRNEMFVQEIIELLVENYLDALKDDYDLQ